MRLLIAFVVLCLSLFTASAAAQTPGSQPAQPLGTGVMDAPLMCGGQDVCAITSEHALVLQRMDTRLAALEARRPRAVPARRPPDAGASSRRVVTPVRSLVTRLDSLEVAMDSLPQLVAELVACQLHASTPSINLPPGTDCSTIAARILAVQASVAAHPPTPAPPR